jgi:drug/metabolite transporter (DMT)-like permease
MAVASILIASVLWSWVPVLIKFSEPYFSSTFVAFARLALAAFSMGLCVVSRQWFQLARGGKRPVWPGAGARGAVIGAGVAFGIHYLLGTAGIYGTTASATNILIQVEVVALVILGILVLRERLRVLRAAGMALCVVGIALVVWSGESLRGILASEYFSGNMLVIAAGICWSFYGLFQKIALRKADIVESLFAVFLIAMTVSAAGFLAQPSKPLITDPVGIKPWLWILALGIGCTGLSYLFLAYGLRILDASAAALISSPLPLLTMLEAHWLLGEPLTPYLWWGAALTALGVVGVTLGERRPAPPTGALNS